MIHLLMSVDPEETYRVVAAVAAEVLLILSVVVIIAAAVWHFVKKYRMEHGIGKTVPATFESSSYVRGRANLADKGRVAGNAVAVALEHRLLTFRSEDGKELRFAVDTDVAHDWREGSEGRLTYNGGQFIGFEAN